MSRLEGMKISDEMLDNVSGGVKLGKADDDSVRIQCPVCFEFFKVSQQEANKEILHCPLCHKDFQNKKTVSEFKKALV